MTQDEIIEMARQVGCPMADMMPMYFTDKQLLSMLEAFAKLVAAKAIAELESQEPMATIAVRWHEPVGKVAYVLEVNLPVGVHKLYTHPPQRTEQEPMEDDFFKMIADSNPKPFPPPQRTWIGLTDEEINEWTPEIHSVIQAIEAKLKEKNT